MEEESPGCSVQWLGSADLELKNMHSCQLLCFNFEGNQTGASDLCLLISINKSE